MPIVVRFLPQRSTRELEVIFILWGLFALVTAGSRMLDPRGPRFGSPVAVGFAWLGVAHGIN